MSTDVSVLWINNSRLFFVFFLYLVRFNQMNHKLFFKCNRLDHRWLIFFSSSDDQIISNLFIYCLIIQTQYTHRMYSYIFSSENTVHIWNNLNFNRASSVRLLHSTGFWSFSILKMFIKDYYTLYQCIFYYCASSVFHFLPTNILLELFQ